jgi:hypothetical protein
MNLKPWFTGVVFSVAVSATEGVVIDWRSALRKR